ncbi:MAG: 6-phosphofructokinase [Candidatus Komeilibacteria bacterium]|nr:6-phosphofructokinase [Candidatus Komeilibacteria bacterium]
MAKQKTILLLTGGGLAPALNATLYGAILAARKYHWRILGGVSGWISLAQNGRIVDLTKLDISSLKNHGGDFLRSSRTNPFKVQNGLELIREKIAKYKIDGIMAIGGDDTLKAAAKLYQQEKIPIIGLPKTVDNDLPQTYFCPGFPSAAYNTAQLTAETKEDSAYTLSRVFIIETYGAQSGFLTASAALGGADIVIPPEWKFNLKDILKIIKQKYEANGNYCVIALSKEARIKGIKGLLDTQFDGFGNKRQEFISLNLKKKIENNLGLSVRIIIPMNFVQSGMPIKLDWDLGEKLGQAGIKLIKQNQFGKIPVIIRKNGKFTIRTVSLNNLKGREKLDTSLFNRATMLPTKKYFDYLKTILGNTKFIDRKYLKLQQKIAKK